VREHETRRAPQAVSPCASRRARPPREERTAKYSRAWRVGAGNTCGEAVASSLDPARITWILRQSCNQALRRLRRIIHSGPLRRNHPQRQSVPPSVASSAHCVLLQPAPRNPGGIAPTPSPESPQFDARTRSTYAGQGARSVHHPNWPANTARQGDARAVSADRPEGPERWPAEGRTGRP
jgi:hypothetical protein